MAGPTVPARHERASRRGSPLIGGGVTSGSGGGGVSTRKPSSLPLPSQTVNSEHRRQNSKQCPPPWGNPDSHRRMNERPYRRFMPQGAQVSFFHFFDKGVPSMFGRIRGDIYRTWCSGEKRCASRGFLLPGISSPAQKTLRSALDTHTHTKTLTLNETLKLLRSIWIIGGGGKGRWKSIAIN